MRMLRSALAVTVAAAGLVLPPTPADAADPYAKSDESWIAITGTVQSPTADTFRLDYGDGTILVEMDDWDTYGDAYGLMSGHTVTVYGRVDDDLYEIAKIEAGSVYDQDLGTYFYASSADEEGAAFSPYYWSVTSPLIAGEMMLRGTVTRVDAGEEEFAVDTGLREVIVEVDELGYNPLDGEGYQRIERGDRVSVSGRMDHDFLEGRRFEADLVITLSDANAIG